jgi:hypothetical protein
MKRLRHPINAIREPFGKAGLIIAVIALVFAMVGGAFAAKGALTGKQKKEVEKIAKKYAGKTGPAGPQGPAGTNGTNGKDGANGKDGTNGTNGKSVTTGNAALAECEEGGITVEVEGTPATKKKVCNGEEGKEGSPWTAGGTLPPEKTETGAWVPISFPIPLAAKIMDFHIT